MPNLQFNFSLKTSVVCAILCSLMFYASYWQYTKYIAKSNYIQELDQRTKLPVENLISLISRHPDFEAILHRKVQISGEWDYSKEFVIRNRKHQDTAGVLIVTPLKLIDYPGYSVLVSRGFIPLSQASQENRKQFQNKKSTDSIIALTKATVTRRFLAPSDPEAGLNKSWIDAWLRMDIESISRQIPYKLLPFYLEILPEDHANFNSSKVLQTKSDKDQILFMPGAGSKTLHSLTSDFDAKHYPIPFQDPVLPPARHFSYIFEWAIMGLMVIAVAIIMQLKRQ